MPATVPELPARPGVGSVAFYPIDTHRGNPNVMEREWSNNEFYPAPRFAYHLGGSGNWESYYVELDDDCADIYAKSGGRSRELSLSHNWHHLADHPRGRYVDVDAILGGTIEAIKLGLLNPHKQLYHARGEGENRTFIIKTALDVVCTWHRRMNTRRLLGTYNAAIQEASAYRSRQLAAAAS